VSRRVWLVPAVSAFALVCAAPAGAQSVVASCDTPPANRDSCNRWYATAKVILDWDWNPAAITTAGCEGGTLSAEGRVERSCLVEWLDTTLRKKVWIGIDRTPPQLVALQPARPPNANGWFNRPVRLTFVGSDSTSGVVSCSSTTYGGPDGLGVPISGSCSDAAGNVEAGSLPINYDATAPERPTVEVRPGNGRVSLGWSAPQGVEARVVRTRKGGKRVVVFSGAGEHITDRRLRNGRRYRYVVTLIDQAGNQAADAASAVPTTSPLLLPARGAHVGSAPALVWKPVRRARYYNAQLLRRGHKILTRWPRAPHLQLRGLVPARYCWYVWPGFGERSQHRYGDLIGKSCFTVVRR
jgi:hypothetical protein